METEGKSILGKGNSMCKGRGMCLQSSAARSARANLRWKEGQEALNAMARIFIEGEQLEPQQDPVSASAVIHEMALSPSPGATS